ncbi:MAG: molybdopterin-dependent oxidoreductase [Mycobacteriales bacterium]
MPLRPSREAVLAAMDRAYLFVLVSAAIFELVGGLLDMAHWYAWGFSFRATHYAVAWVAIGALVLHIGIKLPVIRDALGRSVDDDGDAAVATGPGTEADARGGLSRRGLLRTTWAAASLALVATAGQTVPWLRHVSLLGVRSGDGPLGVPINRTAAEAGVPADAGGDAWRLEVVYAGTTTRFTRTELEAMGQTDAELPIACVEGWSASGLWSGVRLSDLVAAVSAGAGARVFLSSLQTRGAFAASELPAQFVDDPRTLLALRLAGEPLTRDHGYPCRIIAPNRPGVLQTKWITRIEVFA